jgi:carboxyl-terminal processing protease
MMIKKNSGILVSMIVFLFHLTGSSQNTPDQTFEILKNLDIYADVVKELQAEYVDEIQPGEMTKSGIDAMLGALDPYTNYIPETEVEDYKFMTTGQYGGIGALIHQQGDFVIISEPYEGSPAHKSGLLAGDRILEVNGQNAQGKTYDEVSAILKGQAGTTVQLKILRDGSDQPLEKNIIRENIKIENIPYYGFIAGDIGFIKLTGFTQNAGREAKQAFLKLKENPSLRGIIMDLRGNGGGLLNESVDLANIFVERNQEIVTTKGKVKDRNRSYGTTFPPVDLKIPLIVLVDNQSASASEIFAGAIQDLDRGVIVGQRTFGKGLVQNVVPLSYNAQLKITVAKYYIPSGRCIQAIDYSHKDSNGYFTKIPDSLIREFRTKNGRKVYDGGGITPDITVTPRRFSQIALTLYNRFLIFNYATRYNREHPTIPPVADFHIQDSTYREFLEFIRDQNYTYTTRSEQALDRLRSEAEKEHYFTGIKEEYDRLKIHMEEDKKADITKYESQIRELMRMEIVSRYYFQKGKVEASLENDPELAMAVEILNDPAKYQSILSGTYIPPAQPLPSGDDAEEIPDGSAPENE